MAMSRFDVIAAGWNSRASDRCVILWPQKLDKYLTSPAAALLHCACAAPTSPAASNIVTFFYFTSCKMKFYTYNATISKLTTYKAAHKHRQCHNAAAGDKSCMHSLMSKIHFAVDVPPNYSAAQEILSRFVSPHDHTSQKVRSGCDAGGGALMHADVSANRPGARCAACPSRCLLRRQPSQDLSNNPTREQAPQAQPQANSDHHMQTSSTSGQLRPSTCKLVQPLCQGQPHTNGDRHPKSKATQCTHCPRANAYDVDPR
eukprot:1158076-Pelagomonas_calceolata.AAC.15